MTTLLWLKIEFTAFITAVLVFFIGLSVDFFQISELSPFGPLYLSVIVFLILTLVNCIMNLSKRLEWDKP